MGLVRAECHRICLLAFILVMQNPVSCGPGGEGLHSLSGKYTIGHCYACYSKPDTYARKKTSV